MSGFNLRAPGLLAFTLMYSSFSAAQTEGASIPVGDADLTPAVEIEYRSTDNAFLSATEPEDSSGVIVSPSFSLNADRRTTELRLNYRGDYAAFDDDKLDFIDHQLGVVASQEINRRLRVGARASFARTHEALGRSLTSGLADELDEQITFDEFNANLAIGYGAQAARGNIRAGVGIRDRSPNNLLEIADTAGFSSVKPFVEFSLRISSDTRVVTGLEFDDVDYDNSEFKDRESTTAYLGLLLAPTGKLSGSMRLGISDVDFVNPGTEDAEEVVINMALRYEPVDFSTFRLNLRRDFELGDELPDSNDTNDVVIDRVQLQWRHVWSSRVFHEATLGYTSADRTCPARSSDTNLQSFFVNVFLQRWLVLGAGVTLDERDGGSCSAENAGASSLDFDRQRIGVKLRATL